MAKKRLPADLPDDVIVHRKMSISLIRSHGLKPIMIQKGSKFPIAGFELSALEVRDHGETIRRLEADPNIGIGAVFEGKLVDIDIDVDKSDKFSVFKDCVRKFCPPTTLSWGRDSHPNSHFVHWLDKDFKPESFQRIKSMFQKRYPLEIRGGEFKTLKYTVLPGSIHETGELIRWSEIVDLDPTLERTKVNTDDLFKQLRLAGAATLLSEYWVEGNRNELSLAFSGMAYRMAAQSVGPFIVTRDDIVRVLTAAMEYAEDTDATRLKNLMSTWDKLSKDEAARVTGGARFAELTDADARRHLYSFLCDDPSIQEKEEAADAWVIWEGRGLLVNLQMMMRGNEDAMMSRDAAAVSAGHRYVHNSEGGRVPMVQWLVSSPMVQRVSGICFKPGVNAQLVETKEGVKINTWSGMGTEPHPEPVSDDDVFLFTQYIMKVIANNKPERYEWVMAWLADMLQDPGNKPGTCLVLTGKQGAGKTFLGAEVMRALLSDKYYIHFNTLSGLVGTFNHLLDKRIFVQADEAAAYQQKAAAVELKSLITEKTIQVNPKNIKQYSTDNHMRILITSNKKDPVQIDATESERRFTVFEVGDAYVGNLKHWKVMHDWIANRTNLAKLARWLMDYKYEKELIQKAFKTKEKMFTQAIQAGVELDWILNCLAEGYLLDPLKQEHWYEQFHEPTLNFEAQKYDRISVEEWPTHAVMPLMQRSLFEFAKAANSRISENGLDSLIRKVLPKIGTPFRARIKVNDRKSGKIVEIRPRIQKIPTEGEIVEHLLELYGEIVRERLDEAVAARNVGNSEFGAKTTDRTKYDGKEAY